MDTGSHTTTGTLTFLFTDIVGSTERWQADGRSMAEELARHDEVLRGAIVRHGGRVLKHTGDGVVAVFAAVDDAVGAAVAAQDELAIGVRMGMHSGQAEARDGDFFGPTLNRAARVMDAGQAGQVLLSAASAALATVQPTKDLGLYTLKGLGGPERIFQIGEHGFPPLRASRHGAGNLPRDLTSFVGRQVELVDLARHLENHRLVTLIGVGGTGKTRLAVEAARAASGSFADGVWLVELAAVHAADAVASALADAVEVSVPADRDVVDELVARLHQRRLLLVVDNCEHVLAAAADVVDAVLGACPHVVVVATSREPLMLQGEQLYPVPSLDSHEAEALFLDRLRAEIADQPLSDEQMAAVAELCRRLDGLPLALELAASRGRALSPVDIANRLDERFRLLVGGRRARMERHQTMRGTLDWSYDMLVPVEQLVFDRLSVFPSSFDSEAAAAVAAFDGVTEDDVMNVLPQLVDRSLIQRVPGVRTSRYRLLETMRAYGRERLLHSGAIAEARERHARYVGELGGRLLFEDLGDDEENLRATLEALRADAVLAVDWAIEHEEWDLGLAAAAVPTYASEREVSEGIRRLLQAALDAGAPDHLVAELTRWDATVPVWATPERMAAAWNALEYHPVPLDRPTLPPMNQFLVGGLEAHDVDRFIELSRRWTSVGHGSGFNSYFVTIRALVHNRHLEAAVRHLEEFRMVAAATRRLGAQRAVDELSGLLARSKGDWDSAATFYRDADRARVGAMANWFDLAVAWHHLSCRSLASPPFDCTAEDLVAPWDCLVAQDLSILETHGCASTSAALHRLGEDALARRFLARTLDLLGTVAANLTFDDVIDATGMSRSGLPSVEPLSRLIDDLRVFAATLPSD